MDSAVSSIIYSRKGVCGFMHILILALSLFLVISISIDTFKNISFLNQPSYIKMQFWICVFFLFDFFFEFFLSNHKWRYLRSHFLFLLISIPYINIMELYNIHFSMEMIYYMRFVPLLRGGYALVIVIGWLSVNKISTLFSSYITLLISTVYFASLIFFVEEHKHNPLVLDYWSALWWASMDVTTVGSNIVAVTPVGKILSVLLAALGMMMFPIFTVYVTNVIQRSDARKKQFFEQSAIDGIVSKDLNKIEDDIHSQASSQVVNTNSSPTSQTSGSNDTQ